jgi:hypothetical protein
MLMPSSGTPKRYAYRLTDKGIRVALMFIPFYHRVCGPSAKSLFLRQPTQLHMPTSELLAAYHGAARTRL